MEANARALGVDLGETDILVLSHGHYDNTGGISRVLKHARKVAIPCHPGVLKPRFSIRDGKAKPIQIPQDSKSAIDRLPPHQLHWISQPVMLSMRIGLTGPIPRETSRGDGCYLRPML